MRRGTSWISTYLALPPASGARRLVTPAWVLLVTLSVMWAQRQPAKRRDLIRRTAPYWAGTVALYGTALFVGIRTFPQRSAFWLPAAALVGVPLAYGAWREARR